MGVRKMAAKPSVYRILSITLLLAAFLVPASVRAIEVKKDLNVGGGGGGGGGTVGGGPAPKNPLSTAQQKALFDTVASDSDQFVAEESEKKSSGQPYVDLDHAAFSYVPKSGGTAIEAKLTGAELKARKSDPTKSSATGKKKALVFEYKVSGTQFTASEPPKWEDVDTGTAAKK